MPTVKQIGLDEVRALTEKMKAFEQASSHVKVNIEHSVKIYVNFITSGIGAMFALYADNGEIIGGLGCIKAPDIHDGSLMAVETFWMVLPEHRGQGLKLFRAFENWADEQGCKVKAMIHMADSFPFALAKLYKRKGYELAEYHFIKRG